CPVHRFTLTFPSADWKVKSRHTHVADFYRKNPDTIAGVPRVWPAADRDEFETVAKVERAFLHEVAGHRVEVEFAPGTNQAGNPYYFADVDEDGPDGHYSLGVSIVWCRKQRVAVVVLLEGQHRQGS